METHVDSIRSRHSRRPRGSRGSRLSRRAPLQTHTGRSAQTRGGLCGPGCPAGRRARPRTEHPLRASPPPASRYISEPRPGCSPGRRAPRRASGSETPRRGRVSRGGATAAGSARPHAVPVRGGAGAVAGLGLWRCRRKCSGAPRNGKGWGKRAAGRTVGPRGTPARALLRRVAGTDERERSDGMFLSLRLARVNPKRQSGACAEWGAAEACSLLFQSRPFPWRLFCAGSLGGMFLSWPSLGSLTPPRSPHPPARAAGAQRERRGSSGHPWEPARRRPPSPVNGHHCVPATWACRAARTRRQLQPVGGRAEHLGTGSLRLPRLLSGCGREPHACTYPEVSRPVTDPSCVSGPAKPFSGLRNPVPQVLPPRTPTPHSRGALTICAWASASTGRSTRRLRGAAMGTVCGSRTEPGGRAPRRHRIAARVAVRLGGGPPE